MHHLPALFYCSFCGIKNNFPPRKNPIYAPENIDNGMIMIISREPFFNKCSSGCYEAPIEKGSRRSS